MGSIAASYVDGRHAVILPVDLEIADGCLRIGGPALERRIPIEAVEITDAIGSAPRLVHFPEGACCEPADAEQFARLLESQGIGRSRLSTWERSPSWIAGSLLALLIVLSAAYRWGLPAAARVVANRMPNAAVQRLSEQLLRVLDRTIFEQSRVSASRQAEIALAFERLTFPPASPSRRYEIQFRKSDRIGANAMALPNGVIIVSDELVAIAQDDREILAVLAHEAGHVAGRHGLRQMLQGSAVAFFITWFLGDMSAVAAAAPMALLQAKYSRDLEREADDYASGVLHRSGISTAHLAAMLERLETAHRARGGTTLEYLSTHPATAERLDRLRTR